MGIGILVHGMNLTNVKGEDWEKLVFGEPPNKLGIMPTTVLELLNAFIRGDDVKAVVFGSGGSQKDGIKESEYTKRFLLEHIKELGEFLAIGTHPGFKSPEGQRFLKKHLAEIICDTSSQNTLQEVENAAAIFTKQGINHVIDISCGSHLPRCIVIQQQVREAGKIPAEQRWYAVPDDMTFGDLPIQKSVVILEAPHRGDDPMISAELMPHQVFPRIFRLSPERRRVLFSNLDTLLMKEGV